MSDVQADSWVDNPFTFAKQYSLPDIKPLPVDLRNPLKDCFTALKAKYIKMPPAKIKKCLLQKSTLLNQLAPHNGHLKWEWEIL